MGQYNLPFLEHSFDKGLSADHSISCASCHRPDRLFADGFTRNAPSLVNAAFHASQFWDGRRPDLESQAADPLVNPAEHGLRDHESVLRYLRHEPTYKRAFSSVFGIAPALIRIRHVGAALAAFERTLIAGNSPFDRYVFKSDATALSASAQCGLALFQGRAQCANCHRKRPSTGYLRCLGSCLIFTPGRRPISGVTA